MKKRIISLFVVFSMLSAFFVSPSAFAVDGTRNDFTTANAASDFLYVKSIEPVGKGDTFSGYDVTFCYNHVQIPDITQQELAFQIFSSATFESEYAANYEEIWGNASVNGGMNLVFSNTDGLGKHYSKNVTAKVTNANGFIIDTTNHTFTYRLPMTTAAYNTVTGDDSTTGEEHNIFVRYYCNGGADSMESFEIKADGTFVVPCATVTFDFNGGKVGNDTTKVIELTGADIKAYNSQDALKTLAGVTPTREGYKFVGWTTGVAAESDIEANETPNTDGYSCIDSLAVNDAKTVKAVWQHKKTLTATDFELNPTNKDYTGANLTTTVQKKGSVVGTVGAVSNVKYDGAAAAKAAKAYTVTFDVAESADYKKATGLSISSFTVNKADWASIGTTNVAVGTAIGVGKTLTLTAKGKVAADDVANATYTITELKKNGTTINDANQKAEDGVTYTAKVTVAATNSNYNASTANLDLTINTASLTSRAVTITNPANLVYDGNVKKPTVSVAGLNASDYTVTYKKADGTIITDPKDAGEYTVVVKLTDAAAASNKLSGTGLQADGTVTGTYTVTPKPITAGLNAGVTLTKTYDTTTDVKKADGSALAIADLKLNGVVGSDDVSLTGTLAAAYADANVGANKAFTVTGLSLNGAKKDNYTLGAISLTGAITEATVTATLKAGVTKSKVYGGANITFDVADFDLAPNVTVQGAAFASEANDAKKGVGDYAITATDTDNNYKLVVNPASKASVTQAEYVIEGTVTTNVGIGVDLATPVTVAVGATSDIKVKGVDGNPVVGTIAISSATPRVTTEADADNPDGITGLNWTFTPTTADGNYKPLSGTNAVVKVDKAPRYKITCKADPDASGTVAVDAANNEAKENDTVTVTLTANSGYRAKAADAVTVKDADNGNVAVTAGASNTYTFTMPAKAVTVTGAFVKEYTITADSAVTVDKAAAIAGEEVTITGITPPEGQTGGTAKVTYTKADGTTADVPVTNNKFTMPEGNVKVEAVFDAVYTITADATVEVNKTSAPKGAEVEVSAKVEAPEGYKDGTGVVKVTYTKDGEEVDVPVTDGKFTMPEANVTVTAVYDKLHTITLPTVTGVTVTADPTAAAKGDEVTITVTPDADHKAGAVKVTYTDGTETKEITVGADGKFIMPDADVTVEVELASKYNVTVKTVEDGGKGTAVADKTTAFAGEQITVTPTVTSGKVKSVTAKDADGKTIKATAKDGKYVVVMPDSNVEITVTFGRKSTGGGSTSGPNTYTVKYSAGDHGTLDGVKSESVESGKKPVKVPTVVPMEGYTFKGWSTDGKTTVDPTTVEIKKATTFTAIYEEVVATPAPTQKPEGVEHKLYMHGYEEDGSFRADAPIKRAEVATMFAYSLTDYTPGQSFDNPYWDVADDAWYNEYVLYLSNLGVIEGYDDGTFRPEEAITRQEFATMLAKLGEVLPAGEMPFSDVSAEEQWGIDYIYTTYANGWVAGYEDGTFRPDNWITRAEAVKMVNGYLKRVVDSTTFDGVEYHDWYDVDKSHWAYYEILEASNDHTCTKDTPEKWLEVGQFGY